ncbi:class_I_transcription_factor_A [Leishmania braziliensis MHOM/BR/75/M2904]|nr:class_I_transcription_factor_A [Leishmania braziliensis MHOM/BR/75/M2904]
MPTKETQVYWHDLPTPRPPWRNAGELKQCILESRRIASQMAQKQWSSVRSATSRPQRSIPRVPRSRAEQADRTDQRGRATRRIERPALLRQVVPEPHATPLQVVNLIMEHLRQRPVLAAEAAEVAQRVTLHFNMLTQSSQQPPVGEASLPRCSQGDAGFRGARAATESVLSQVQQQDGARLGLTSSQATIGASGGAAESLSMALQDSLLLDTVAEFCAARSLAFRRLSRSDLWGMRHRVSSVEAVPHRRVVVLADRYDPIFAVFFAVSRQVTPEPFVVSTLQLDGKTVESIPRYRKAEAPATQVFCMAPAPVPWRRITTNISVSTLRDEFVVAVIELDETKETTLAVEDGGMGPRSGMKRGSGAVTSANAPPRKMRRQRSVNLLGDDIEEKREVEQVLMFDPGDNSNGETAIILNPEADQPSPSSFSLEKAPLERRWLDSAPLFSDRAQLAEQAPREMAAELWRPTSGAYDPLLNLPRSEGAARRRRSHRVWYHRLLPKDSNDFMARMHTYQMDE